jgi:hypothetical protein
VPQSNPAWVKNLMMDHTGIFSEKLDKARARYQAAFAARRRTEGIAFHRAALAAGGRDKGKQCLRPHYHAGYCGAFVLDTDDDNIGAVCHDPA